MTDREKEAGKKRNNIANDTAVSDDIQYRPSKQKRNAKDTTAQHALVLQGGGALAAYEVGVYGALYFWRRKEMSKGGEAANNENVFDIIAGTSGGAINGWIIIDHVLNRRRNHGQNIADSWKGSLKSLLDFWDYTTSDPDFTKWSPLSIGLEVDEWLPGFPPLATLRWTMDEKLWISRWDRASENDNSLATGEQARRYYSAKEYLYSGADNVFSPLPRKRDDRFFDNIFPPSNTWYRYSNQPLRDSIANFSKLKPPQSESKSMAIGTAFYDEIEDGENKKKEKREPRLLVVSVDVATGQALTFDSYEKAKGIRKTEYQQYDSDSGDSASGETSELRYDQGITLDHIIASASVPINYDYALVPVNTADLSKGSKEFWDGGVKSNTPLREMIQAHEDYWKKNLKDIIGLDVESSNNVPVPDLEVYMANVWPSKWNGIPPLDHDAIKNRRYELTYHDMTLHEEKIAYLIRDYIELARNLMELAKKRGGIDEAEINEYLDRNFNHFAKSKHRNRQRRRAQELMENKAEIVKVVRIERQFDPNDISYKWCDYSCATITQMIERGIHETLENIVSREREDRSDLTKDKFNEFIKKELNKFIYILDNEKISEGLTQKQAKILTQPVADTLKQAAQDVLNKKLS
jgi:NTE family protein